MSDLNKSRLLAVIAVVLAITSILVSLGVFR